jgi:hypothetical protein
MIQKQKKVKSKWFYMVLSWTFVNHLIFSNYVLVLVIVNELIFYDSHLNQRLVTFSKKYDRSSLHSDSILNILNKIIKIS